MSKYQWAKPRRGPEGFHFLRRKLRKQVAFFRTQQKDNIWPWKLVFMNEKNCACWYSNILFLNSLYMYPKLGPF